MLTRIDETLLHQTSRPMSQASVSDHRFFDRYWFEALYPDADIALILGIGVYKNMNVMDGFVSVQHDLKQYNVRSSRDLRSDINNTSVGPISVRIEEPFRHLVLSVEEGDHPVSCNLDWTSDFSPHVEAHHLDFAAGAVVQDSTRYGQIGRVSGSIDLDGKRYPLSEGWGLRDHSWGVRSGVGGFEPPRVRTQSDVALFLWSYFSSDEGACHFQMHEDARGNQIYMDGQLHWPEGSTRDSVAVVAVEHDISFIEGTRVYDRVTYELTLADNSKLVVEVEPVVRAWAYSGTGYDGGYNDRKGLGASRGSGIIETDVYDVEHPEDVRDEQGQLIPSGHREQPAKVTVNGKTGFGHMVVMPIGPVPKYGLT